MPFLAKPTLATTWAAKPAASGVAVGTRIVVTDLSYSVWYSDGTNWYPQGGHAVLGQQATLFSLGATPGSGETIAWQATIPAGLLVAGKAMLRYMQSVEHLSGTSDTCTVRTRLGTAGTTSDAQVGLGGALATTNLTMAILNHLTVPSATTARRSASGGTNGTVAWSSVSATARPAAVTIANVSNALIFTVTAQMTSGAAETAELDGGLLELFMRP